MASRTLLQLLPLLLLVAAAVGGPRDRGRAGPGFNDLDVVDDGDGDGGGGDDGDGGITPAAAPTVCPERCVCRFDASPKLVDCSGRMLKEFPPFDKIPEDVEFLDLSDNEIRSVPAELPGRERLEGLSLAGNQLENFPPRALAAMAALEMLDLSRNSIPSLRHMKPDRFLRFNPVLQVLNLSGNGLQDLGHGSFQSLSSESLAVLDVSHCSISSIDGEEALAGLPALRALRAGGNPLAALPALRAPALRELDLSDCRLHAVTAAALAALPGLTHLSVSRNPDLGHFLPPAKKDAGLVARLSNGTAPPPSPRFASLVSLEAEDCSLHEAAFLAALPNLTEARLRGNRIAALEPLGLLDNGALLHLDLADNKLEDLHPQALTGTELLRELDLSGNRLTAIHPDTFAQHGALRRLNVSRNPLTSLQLSAAALYELDVSGAQLQVLPGGVLDGTLQLRHLNLSNNPLSVLPDRLVSPGAEAALLSLDLSLCRLTDLSATALDGLLALQSLDLRGNRLTDPLEVDAFRENAVLHRIRLDDNPWRCDCKSKDFGDFLDFLQAHPAKADIHALTCHGPEGVQGETWFDACLGPGAGALASPAVWLQLAAGATAGVAALAGGVWAVRRLARDKEHGRRHRQQEQDEERRACEHEGAQRRLHRRMQLQQQEQLRRQNMRAQVVSEEDPDPHPPSYEEAVLMDRMTAEAEEAADSDAEDEAVKGSLQKKAARINSPGRTTAVIEEEPEDGDTAAAPAATTAAAAAGSARGARGAGGSRSNGSAHKFDTRL